MSWQGMLETLQAATTAVHHDYDAPHDHRHDARVAAQR